MPKQLIPAGWVEKPCRFLCHESTASSCGFCEGEFGFWNGRRHCHFCGHVFHRRHCTKKIQLNELFFRRRICPNCDYYRNVAAEKLKKGEEFVCVGRRGSSNGAVFIALCEDTAELIIRWKETGVTEAVDLLEVKTRKGFSHRGRLHSVGDYDPLRSISLFLGDGFGGQRSFDVRAPSAWAAQLWVDGLTTAHYVYRCMLEQCLASESETDRDNSHWFSRTLYLPVSRQSSRLSSTSSSSSASSALSCPKTVTRRSLRSWSSSHSESDHEACSTRRISTMSFRSGYLSERSITPTPPHKISGSLPSRYHHQSTVLSIEPRHGESPPGSTPGLPYVHSSFSAICPCHAYEITPSRSIDLRTSEVGKKPTGKACCKLCRNACKIVIDMDNAICRITFYFSALHDHYFISLFHCSICFLFFFNILHYSNHCLLYSTIHSISLIDAPNLNQYIQ